jgi:hypothetical protein
MDDSPPSADVSNKTLSGVDYSSQSTAFAKKTTDSNAHSRDGGRDCGSRPQSSSQKGTLEFFKVLFCRRKLTHIWPAEPIHWDCSANTQLSAAEQHIYTGRESEFQNSCNKYKYLGWRANPGNLVMTNCEKELRVTPIWQGYCSHVIKSDKQVIRILMMWVRGEW